MCGAGLDHAIAGEIEVSYQTELKFLAGAKVRERISAILDANAASREKYKDYLDCVSDMHDALFSRRNCRQSCEALRHSCEAEVMQIYDLCIAAEVRGCIQDCKSYRRWSDAKCVADLCNWTTMPEEARELHTQRCKHKRRYINQRAECAADLGNCLAEC